MQPDRQTQRTQPTSFSSANLRSLIETGDSSTDKPMAGELLITLRHDYTARSTVRLIRCGISHQRSTERHLTSSTSSAPSRMARDHTGTKAFKQLPASGQRTARVIPVAVFTCGVRIRNGRSALGGRRSAHAQRATSPFYYCTVRGNINVPCKVGSHFIVHFDNLHTPPKSTALGPPNYHFA